MQVEGVLRKPVTGAVIESGRRLYLGLAQFSRIVLVTSETDPEYFSSWLGLEALDRHDHVVYGNDFTSATRERWPLLASALKIRYGYDTDVFVVPDPEAAMHLMKSGFNVLLFMQSAYALPEWRPDQPAGVQPWNDLVNEVQIQKIARAADKRMEDGDLR